jgi:hypothetical protein
MKRKNAGYWLSVCALLIVAAVPAIGEPNTGFEMKPRPTDENGFPEYIQYLVDVAEPRTAEEWAADADIKKKYRQAMVIDALFVGGPGFPAGFTEAQYEEAVQHSIDNQYDVISATLSNGPPEDTPDVVLERMANVNAYWARQPGRYIQVRAVEDMQRARNDGRIGFFHKLRAGCRSEPIRKTSRRTCRSTTTWAFDRSISPTASIRLSRMVASRILTGPTRA